MLKSKNRLIKKKSRTKKNYSIYTDEAKRIIGLINDVKKTLKHKKNNEKNNVKNTEKNTEKNNVKNTVT